MPASTVVLDSASLLPLPSAHPSEMLPFLSGFNVARPFFYAGRPVVSSRGFFGGGEAEYVRLLIDGVPVGDVESGLIDWAAVPAAAIQRVEAVRGAGASLYGDSAIGGVIQILSVPTTSGGQATLTAGSFGTLTGDGAYTARPRGVALTASGAARRTGGGFDHSGGREIVGGGGAGGTMGGLSWRWNASGNDRQRDDPGALNEAEFASDPYSSNPLYEFDNTDRRGFSTALTIRKTGPRWYPQVRAYVTTRDEALIRTILLAPPDLGDRRARELSSLAMGGSAEGEHALTATRPLVVRFGADLARQDLDTTYRGVDPTGAAGDINSAAAGHRIRAGLFASAAWDPASRLRLSGGIRWDDVRDSGFGAAAASAPEQRAWSPRIGAVVRVTDDGSVTLFGQLSKAFKVPTLDQLFDPRPYPDFQGGTFTISNPNLVPQRATNIEAGISGHGTIRWSALVYRMHVNDEIDFNVNTFSYANIGERRHAGLELEAEARWWTRWRPSLSYARSDVSVPGSDLQLKNVPRHLLSAAAHVNLPWAIGLYARYNHTWEAFLDDGNAFPLDGPSTLDLRVRRPLGRQTLFVDVLNAAGRVYEEYGFTLQDFRGREIPYVYPGAPRALRAGLTLSF